MKEEGLHVRKSEGSPPRSREGMFEAEEKGKGGGDENGGTDGMVAYQETGVLCPLGGP